MTSASTLGELKAQGYAVRPVKLEMRENLIAKLREGGQLFPGIIGYDETVVPQIVNAILAQHDIVLLGLRGQAKTRLARMLVSLLDEWTPIVRDSEINDNPFAPVSYYATERIAQLGDATPIEWIHRSERYGEKLATPDVTIADLIGDIDPLKAAHHRLHYSHEGAIHFGIIPRSNRGIFTINELPDLQPRIQVGLFNILEERDIQIRGFNIRMPLDVMIVFTANPEDYTNRGSIITPLKDRIAAQILTHYPLTIETAIAITEQEAWTSQRLLSGYGTDGIGGEPRIGDEPRIVVPHFFKEIVEQIAFEARASDFIDQKSGVSARLTVSAMETLISNAERRAILQNEYAIVPRVADLSALVTSVTGKVELVFEGEQEGMARVAKALIAKAVRTVFRRYFPDPMMREKRKRDERPTALSTKHSALSTKPGMKHAPGAQPEASDPYEQILRYFADGNTVAIDDMMPAEEYARALDQVPTLRALAVRYMKLPEDALALTGTTDPTAAAAERAAAMEFVLDGLHHHSRIARIESIRMNGVRYRDMVGSIFNADDSDEEYE